MVDAASSSPQPISTPSATMASPTPISDARTEPMMAEVKEINHELETAKAYLGKFFSEREIVEIGDSQKLVGIAGRMRQLEPQILQKSSRAVTQAIKSTTGKQIAPKTVILERANWESRVAQSVLRDLGKTLAKGEEAKLPDSLTVRLVVDEQKNVGIYRIVKTLGQGSFGKVHAAEEVGKGEETFALKEARRKDAVSDIRHEVRNLALIHQRGRRPATVAPSEIVQLSDGKVAMRAIRHQGSMEKFSKIAETRKLSPEQSRAVIQDSVRPLLVDLNYYQQIGRPHGDIKRENLFLGNNDRIMVGDFGGVRSIDRGIRNHDLRGVATPHYVPKAISERFAELESHLEELEEKLDKIGKGINVVQAKIEALEAKDPRTEADNKEIANLKAIGDIRAKAFQKQQAALRAYREEIKPEVKQLREKMDLFAIGAAMIEMMADREIFNEEDPNTQQLRQICGDDQLKFDMIHMDGYPEGLVNWAFDLINPDKVMNGSFEQAIRAFDQLKL